MLRNTIAVCGSLRADLPRRLDAVQNRHGDVHHHHVRPMLLRQRHRLAAVGRLRHHLKARLALQQHAQAFAHDRVVVRQQDPNRSS